MKYRSRFEIISAILRVSLDEDGATKTKIMFKAYLSFKQVTDYLVFMEGKDLVVRDDRTSEYTLTSKGIKFLKTYEELKGVFGLTGETLTVQATRLL